MRHWQHMFLTILLSCLALPAAMCSREPVTPVPAVVGGQTSTGGASAVGGASTGGISATGGTTAESSTVTAVRFPECNPASQKAKPVDRSKMRLGRKTSAVTKHRKVSYSIATDAKSVFWPSLISRPLNQRELGACTGFATLQARLNAPFTLPIPGALPTLDDYERLARDVYSGATKRDPWLGAWPPTDTGSNGESALDEALSRGIFSGYSTIDSLAGLQRALQSGPVIAGVDWYDGFFAPTRCGEAKATGPVVGGHEIAIVGLDVDEKTVWWLTSWDADFGVCLDGHCGYGYFTYGVMSDLFARGGDSHRPLQ